MGLDAAGVEHERPAAVAHDEVGGPVSYEARHLEPRGQAHPELAGEDPSAEHILVRLDTLVEQKPVVVGVPGEIGGVGALISDGLDRADPLVEPVLRAQLVPQVPLANVRLSVVAWEHLSDGLDRLGHGESVAGHTRRVRVQPCHNGRARRGADGLGHVGVLEYKGLIGEGVEVRHLDPVVAVAAQGIEALAVAEEENEVVFSRHRRDICGVCRWRGTLYDAIAPLQAYARALWRGGPTGVEPCPGEAPG